MHPGWVLSLVLAACACSGDVGLAGGGGDGGGGDFGATPGGVKDMGFARELVANGQVPPAEALLVEAMFSEHDLGLAGEPCEDALCLRAASGIAPDREGQSVGWVQIGLSSGVDPETWQRPSTTFVMTVDVSGSMGWEYLDAQYPSPGRIGREILRGLAGVLTAQDRVAIVTYGSEVAQPLPLTRGDDPDLAEAIEALHEGGSTDMEGGLRRAYQIARAAADDGVSEEVRVVLFTDVQPNVGATEPSEFERMVADGADDGVGITVLAVGLGIGPEVLESMAHRRGANAFSFFQLDDVEEFMAEEWPWFTSPIAHELSVEVMPAPDLELADAYGFPGAEEGDLGLEVSSVFLSRRKGALLFSLAGPDLSQLRADMTLRYRTPAGDEVSAPLTASYGGEPLDEAGRYFEQEATARAAALALLVSGMKEAAEIYGKSPEQAEAMMRDADERFAADAALIDDPTLDPEVDLSRRMLQLVTERAPQGTLYGLE